MWTTVKQQGEMAYGQPSFAIPVTDADTITEDKKVIVKTSNVRVVTYVDGEIEREYSYTSTTSCPVYEYAFLLSSNKRAAKFAERKKFIIKNRYLPCSVPKSWREPWKKYIFVQANSFRDVADFANYFGDRLPDAFWEKYKAILIEQPQQGLQQAQEGP